MIYHVSIDADDPQQVATVLAELMGGQATPFPPVIAGSWIAFAGDAHNTAIEVYPRGTELHEVDGDEDAIGLPGPADRRSATHIAIGTTLDPEAVFTIAAQEGWPAKYRKRGDAFGVMELWVEGVRMIEVLTPVMQREYLRTMTIAGWNGFLATVAPKPDPVTA